MMIFRESCHKLLKLQHIPSETAASLAGTKVVFDLPDETERKGFGKPQNCILNTEKLASLGWSGAYTLRQGMEETLAVLRSIKEN